MAACEQPPIALAPLLEQLRIEVRALGSELVEDRDAPARLSIDMGCEAAPRSARVELVRLEHALRVEEEIPLDGAESLARVLAMGVVELVRSRWASLTPAPTAPTPPPLARADIERLIDTRIETHLARDASRNLASPERPPSEPPPPPALPGNLFELLLGVAGSPSGGSALGELRLGFDIALDGPIRVPFGIRGGGGASRDPLGDVALGSVVADVGIALAHRSPDLIIGVGPRILVGWARAQGFPFDASVVGLGVDAVRLELLLTVNARARVADSLFVSIEGSGGAGLVGLDARAEGRRVTAQQGPSLGVSAGLAWTL